MLTIFKEVCTPFYHNGKVHKPLIFLFILINLLVFANAILHNPYQGYDAADHINYIKAFALKRAIPTCADTDMCYFPPLPYLLPAIILATGRINLWEAAKFAQIFNVFLSLGLTYYLIKICDLIDPNKIIFKFSSLVMLGILPVYYKSFSLIRGETYLPLLFVFIVYQVLSIYLVKGKPVAKLVLLGLAVGLSILARQWGLLVLPAIFLFAIYAIFKDHSNFRLSILMMGVCILIPVLVAGWYYFIMFQRLGSLTAWDRRPSNLSLNALPIDFYFGTGSGKLFTDPIRPSFSNQFPAIFYSDTWGDYSAYFLVYAKDKRTFLFLRFYHHNGVFLCSAHRIDRLFVQQLKNNALGRLLASLVLRAVFTFARFVEGLRKQRHHRADIVDPFHHIRHARRNRHLLVQFPV